MLKKIFNITNTYDKKHRKKMLVTILGLKFEFYPYRFINKKNRYVYYSYIENQENFKTTNFVDITNQQYKNSNTVKPIAFYLPQFHSIPLNDKSFGKGFTEWHNVAKAIPLFLGHNQPQLPYDVGFYDLTNDKIMYRQIELAKMYGIYGFCFHYYWFSGKRLLEKPIFNYLHNKDLDLPFCLCWANENWSKLWDGGNKEVIMSQQLNDDDDEKFFYDILPFLKDDRYIKIDNKPLLIIYRLSLFEEERIKKFILKIRELAKQEGFADIYFGGVKFSNDENLLKYGIDVAIEFPPHALKINKITPKYVNKNFNGVICDLSSYVNDNKYTKKQDKKLFKGVFPEWDNSARKARTGSWIFLCNPSVYKKWLKNIIKWTKDNHKEQEQFLFINAWNEWAEGAHLEPDTRYGYAYLQATKEALEEI